MVLLGGLIPHGAAGYMQGDRGRIWKFPVLDLVPRVTDLTSFHTHIIITQMDTIRRGFASHGRVIEHPTITLKIMPLHRRRHDSIAV
jgi:hypothetical protein